MLLTEDREHRGCYAPLMEIRCSTASQSFVLSMLLSSPSAPHAYDPLLNSF
ncbi:hypothetical protein SLEP1_g33319 [Rubroshorea leprosula]|uniref:Uncharacterized protein n=1 Tax=Rubroshorea leprosula TaxID=152421 RepID=A0AAV5KGE0_9ROSI|nr:hypothetical protein SLEP1_g33319 [Rubroshorea leprosula]